MSASIRSYLLILLWLLVVPAAAQDTGFLDRSVSIDGERHDYQVYVPRAYDSSRQWPVILFLHGAGERGSDGLKPTQVGLGRAIRLNPERWPAIVIFPQVAPGESWQGVAGEVAMQALEATINEYAIDRGRQYLTGLSLGGNGTWFLANRHGQRFAALVAVCGFLDLPDRFAGFLPGSTEQIAASLARELAAKPAWLFHGDADRVVPVEQSRLMAEALRAAGAEVHYTELPGVGHNAWDPAYENQEMIGWLFSQRLH